MSKPLLIQALHRQSTPYPPIWLMRQAGRYLPEYQHIRNQFNDFIQFCLTPDAATEVTIQPVERFDVDAAIIFSDILTIPYALGQTVTFEKNHGPIVQKITQISDLKRLKANLPILSNYLANIGKTISQTRTALPKTKAVIGFTGAPWTLATYLLDDKPSAGTHKTEAFFNESPESFQNLIQILTQACTDYLILQAKAGADALQIFDSWAVGCPPHLWAQAVEQPIVKICKNLKSAGIDIPIIVFARGLSMDNLNRLVNQAPTTFEALSLSTEVNLAEACEKWQSSVALQGNLDPLLFAADSPEPLLSNLRQSLTVATKKPGYIVNVGHGLTPATNPDYITRVVEEVRKHHAS